MADWKAKYASAWQASAEREGRLSRALAAALGVELRPCGIGAGRTDRVEGYARDHGSRRGGADYQTPCGRLLVEVTGPNRPVRLDAPLWVRPDKLDAAEAALAAGQVTVILHETPRAEASPVVRMLLLDAAALERRSEWPVVHPSFRGSRETFAEISASDPTVLAWDAEVRRLQATVTPPPVRRPCPFPPARRRAPVLPPAPRVPAPRELRASLFPSSRPGRASRVAAVRPAGWPFPPARRVAWAAA